MSKEKKDNPFEASLAELQQEVKKLESGELTLEESLKSFEKGMELAKECQKFLETAEKKVELLVKKSNSSEFVTKSIEE